MKVTVQTPEGKVYECRTYQIPKTIVDLPSPQYMDVIIRGAVDIGLPADYITRLRNIEHNNNKERVQLYEDVLGMIGK